MRFTVRFLAPLLSPTIYYSLSIDYVIFFYLFVLFWIVIFSFYFLYYHNSLRKVIILWFLKIIVPLFTVFGWLTMEVLASIHIIK